MRDLAIALTIGMALSACAGDDGSGQQLFAPPPGTESPSAATETAQFGFIEAPIPASEGPTSYTETPVADTDTGGSSGSGDALCTSWCGQARATGCDDFQGTQPSQCENQCGLLFAVAPQCGSAFASAFSCALSVGSCDGELIDVACGNQYDIAEECLDSVDLDPIDNGDPPQTDRPNNSGPSEPQPLPDQPSAGG